MSDEHPDGCQLCDKIAEILPWNGTISIKISLKNPTYVVALRTLR